MREPGPDLLFVYGTLRPGGDAPARVRRALEAAEEVGAARMRGRLFVAGGGRFPAAVPADEERWVRGFLYRLTEPDPLLRTLDRYEGRLPDGTGLYRREVIQARSCGDVGEDGEGTVRAWTYLYNRETSGLVEIETGDWLAWRRERGS